MYYLSILVKTEKAQQAVKDAIDSIAEINNIFNGVGYIVGIALFIYLTKDMFTLLINGGKESIDPMKNIVTPLFFVFAFFLFPTILDFITISTNQLGKLFLNPDLDEKAANQMHLLLYEMRMDIIKEFSKAEGFFDKLSALSFQKFFVSIILESFSDLGLWLDKMFIILFATYTQIMIEILKVVGSIALALSFLPGMKNTFLTWLKSFISVNLWFGIAALIFRLINAMSFTYFESQFGMGEIASDPAFYSFGNALLVGFTFIGLGIFKGIMMFKVPQIVSMFIGSTPSGGMFASAFAPVMVGLAAMKGVTAAAKSATSGSFKSK